MFKKNNFYMDPDLGRCTKGILCPDGTYRQSYYFLNNPGFIKQNNSINSKCNK